MQLHGLARAVYSPLTVAVHSVSCEPDVACLACLACFLIPHP